jgi:hypothetical protein
LRSKEIAAIKIFQRKIFSKFRHFFHGRQALTLFTSKNEQQTRGPVKKLPEADYFGVKCTSVKRFEDHVTEGPYLRWLKCSLLPLCLWLGLSTVVLGQRLVVESPSPGPLIRVIYGKITPKSVLIFEKEYPLIRDLAASRVLPSVNPSNDFSVPRNGATDQDQLLPRTERTVLTSFALTPADMGQCLSSPRFVGFKNLALALKTKINSVVINSGGDSGPCADKIAGSLAKTLSDVKITVESFSDDGIKIELGVLSVGTVAAVASDVGENLGETTTGQVKTVGELIKMTRVMIGDQKITPDDQGWFVAELPQQAEYAVEVMVGGYQTVSHSVFASLVTMDVVPVSRGIGYYGRSAEFNRPRLAIKIVETPYLAKKTTIDGGLGGGYGFGREVPGEKKGQRTVAGVGIERRDWFGSMGYRGSLFYSRAPATVVPSTYTIRGSLFYDGEILEGDLFARAGLGLEMFHAKITQPKKKIVTAGDIPTSNIPQQVLAPMLTFSLHTIFFDRLIVSPSLVVTPLYIASVGLYTSTSPGLEFSAKVFKNWIAALQLGTEVHRYPSQLGETRLQLDYGLLTFKRGVF